MWKIVLLSSVQALFLSFGQVFLKLAMVKMEKYSFTITYFKSLFTNWWFLGTGLCFGIATVLWLYIIKHVPLSVAYPLSGIAYIFGMLAAVYIFHESISLTRWLGVLLIMGGVCLILK
ncbi:MAG: EamA family transporter [Bacteroidales bacterium]|jgi:undecaprenyl phosphate-alpha-L-ara4N flippase subunit ArnE|nr:EamA family transporter [Bacteroidales bacterium]